MQIKPSLKLPKTLSAKKWKFTNSGHTGHLKLMMCLMTLYLADLNSQKIFFPMGRSRPLFVYFCSFLITISMIQIEQAKDGVIGIQNHGRRMVDTDETMELLQPPIHKNVSCVFSTEGARFRILKAVALILIQMSICLEWKASRLKRLRQALKEISFCFSIFTRDGFYKTFTTSKLVQLVNLTTYLNCSFPASFFITFVF